VPRLRRRGDVGLVCEIGTSVNYIPLACVLSSAKWSEGSPFITKL